MVITWKIRLTDEEMMKIVTRHVEETYRYSRKVPHGEVTDLIKDGSGYVARWEEEKEERLVPPLPQEIPKDAQ